MTLLDLGGEPILRLPDPPKLLGALREALFDFYYNSWRLVPANVIWGFMLLAVVALSAAWLPLAVLVALLAVPAAGIYRMAALIQRGEGTSFRDFIDGVRRFWAPAFGVGLLAAVLAFVFTVNIFIGLEMEGVAGWIFSAFALYADIALAMFLVAAWPIMVDPLREDLSLRRRLWLAVVLNFARPGRMFALTFIMVALLVASTVLLAALVTVSIAYISLASTRYVLPALDRLEGRPSVQVVE